MRLDRQQQLIRDLKASRARGWTTAELDAELKRRGVEDVTDRISIKREMAAVGELATDEVIQIGMLRTDRPAPGQGGPAQVSALSPAMQRLLARAGVTLKAGTKYSVKQLDALFDTLEIPAEQRIALKTALAEEGFLDEEASHPKAPVRKTTSSMSAAAPGRSCKMSISCNDFDALRR